MHQWYTTAAWIVGGLIVTIAWERLEHKLDEIARLLRELVKWQSRGEFRD